MISNVYAVSSINNGAPNSFEDLNTVFANVISIILPFAGIALFVMLLFGGIQFITAGEDPKKAGQARNTLTYAIGGLILVACAYLIILIISKFTGVESILKFDVTT